MSNWAHGYNVEEGYTYGAFRELSPDWLDLAARLRGFLPPERGNGGRFRYLELGSGQGLGLCILAASYPEAEFVGVDFNPAHTAHALELARAAGLGNVRFLEADFNALAEHWPADLGQFHYAVLHGIYSWVPIAVRRSIARCLQHATLPGALVHNSYNALPGWLAAYPIQHLLRRFQLTSGARGTKVVQNGLQNLLDFEKAGAQVFRSLPGLKPRLEKAKAQNRAYLVQEYLHDHWQPMWFSQVAGEMAEAKLEFVASASLVENELPALLPEAQRTLILQHEDPALQQELVDICINQGFRRDVYARGAPRGFQSAVVPQGRVMRLKPIEDNVKVATPAGDFNLRDPLRKALDDALATGPKTLQALLGLPEVAPAGGALGLRRALVALLHGGYLAPHRENVQIKNAVVFNELLARRVSAQNAPYQHLASPVTGSCLGASPLDLMLLDARARNRKADAATLVEELRKAMARAGRQFVEDGKVVADPEKHAALLRKNVDNFVQKILPSWQAQGVMN